MNLFFCLITNCLYDYFIIIWTQTELSVIRDQAGEVCKKELHPSNGHV